MKMIELDTQDFQNALFLVGFLTGFSERTTGEFTEHDRAMMREAARILAKMINRTDLSPERETDVPFGMFRCEMCNRIFPYGNKEIALAEAAFRGIDPEESGLVCDACYALTPWDSPPGTN